MSKKMWGGRFTQKTNEKVNDFNASIDVDKYMYEEDIAGSVAHASMLSKQGFITEEEKIKILKGLNEILAEINSGKVDDIKVDKVKPTKKYEDIHMAIEELLTKKIGDIGKKLHTARSRNDQVATDIRLFLMMNVSVIHMRLKEFLSLLTSIAKDNIDFIMPGYTHLQRAQPIRFSHHILAYFQMFKRDLERFDDCLKRVNVLPLGSGALAGTTFKTDRDFVAKELGFLEAQAVSSNSMDSVSDRDFVIEFISDSAIIMMHLSRFCEEIIIWNSSEFNFIEISDAFTTGSSIMPQKKNPDVAELIRGKTGRVYGNLMAILTTMKGLPLAYNKDMQEDKEPLFDTVDTVKNCLEIFTLMLKEIKVNAERMRECAFESFSTATDLADYLARKGVPFRDAHEITGKIVRFCIDNGYNLATMPLHEYQKFSPMIEVDVYQKISLESSVEGKISHGGTCKKEVERQIKEAREYLESFNKESK